MMLMLAFGAALAAQDVPAAAPGPAGRFVICPGHRRCPSRPSRRETSPASGRLTGIQYARRLIPDGGILRFARGETRLGPEARALLDRMATRMREEPKLEAMLEGHADPDGSRAANIRLAGWRAEAAADYLVLRGIAADRLLKISWGEAGQGESVEPRSVVVTLRTRPPENP